MEASALQGPTSAGRPRRVMATPLLRLCSDEQLVKLLRDGHDEAFCVIHDRYHKVLSAYTPHAPSRPGRGGGRAGRVHALLHEPAWQRLRSGEAPALAVPDRTQSLHRRAPPSASATAGGAGRHALARPGPDRPGRRARVPAAPAQTRPATSRSAALRPAAARARWRQLCGHSDCTRDDCPRGQVATDTRENVARQLARGLRRAVFDDPGRGGDGPRSGRSAQRRRASPPPRV